MCSHLLAVVTLAALSLSAKEIADYSITYRTGRNNRGIGQRRMNGNKGSNEKRDDEKQTATWMWRCSGMCPPGVQAAPCFPASSQTCIIRRWRPLRHNKAALSTGTGEEMMKMMHSLIRGLVLGCQQVRERECYVGYMYLLFAILHCRYADCTTCSLPNSSLHPSETHSRMSSSIRAAKSPPSNGNSRNQQLWSLPSRPLPHLTPR